MTPKRKALCAVILIMAALVAVAVVAALLLTGRARNVARNPGEIVWTYYTGPYACFNPAAYGDTVYFGSEPGGPGRLLRRILPHSYYLQAVDADTGKIKWRRKVGNRVTVAPIVADDTVYFGTWAYQFLAVDEKTGKEKWSFVETRSFQSSPVLTPDGESILLPWQSGNIYMLARDAGDVLWQYAAGGRVESGLAVQGNTVFGGNSDGRVFAVDLDTGRQKWIFTAGNAISNSTPAISGETLYVGSEDGNLYALDVATGGEKWRFPALSPVITSPRVADGNVFFGCAKGTLHCVDALLGTSKWGFKARGLIMSSPAFADGIVYFGCDGGIFYAVDAQTGKELWSLDVGRPIRSDPVIAGNVVCFGDWSENMYAVCIKPPEKGK